MEITEIEHLIKKDGVKLKAFQSLWYDDFEYFSLSIKVIYTEKRKYEIPNT